MPSIILKSFHGGINLKTSQILMRIEEARMLKNVDVDEVGTLKKSKGYSLFGNVPNTSQVLALVAFYKIGSTIERILLRDGGGEVRRFNFSTNQWDAITGATGLSTTKKPVWIIYQNLAIRFNGVDSPKKYDGTTFGNLGGNPFNGDVATLFKERIYVAGVSPNFSTIYFSKTGDPEGWLAGNSTVINQNDGDRIMALKGLGDSLLVFKEKSIWEIQVDNKNFPAVKRPLAFNMGTTSQFSLVENQGVLYFFDRNGIYQITGKYPELISLRVEPIIRGVQDPYGVFGWSFGTKNYWWLGDVKLEDRVINNVILVYDIMLDFWSVMIVPHQLTAAVEFIGDNKLKKIYLGNSVGKTYLFLDGYQFENKPIEFLYESPNLIVGDPRSEKIFRKIIVRTKNKIGGTPSVFVFIDDEAEAVISNICDKTYKIIELPPNKNAGREIKIVLAETSKEDMRDVYLLEIVYDEVISERI